MDGIGIGLVMTMMTRIMMMRIVMPGDKAAGHHSLDFLGLSRGSRTCAPVSSLIEVRIGAGVATKTLILMICLTLHTERPTHPGRRARETSTN